MDLPSDTESESTPESSQAEWRTIPGSPLSAQHFHQAIADIQNIDFNEPSNYDTILVASDIIIQYLHLPDLQLSDITPLVHPDLLNVLCQQRAVFHTIAANAIVPGTVAATVVCWADSILATLADTIAALAGGTSQNMPGSLGLQRDEDNLRAAAQLPYKWSAVMKVIGCDQTSPGALRIALRLAFAVVVLGPQHLDPWAASKVPSSEFLATVQRCIVRTVTKDGVLADFSALHLRVQERLNFAIMIALFAAAEFSGHAENVSGHSSRMIPRITGYLLALLQAVLNWPGTNQVCVILDDLDPAEKVLMMGTTMHWCWEVWEDPRVAHAEVVAFLTVNWLYHAVNDNTSLVCRNASSSCSALLAVLHHSVSALIVSTDSMPPVPTGLPLVILRSGQGIVHLLQSNLNSPDSRVTSRLPDIAKRFTMIFLLLQDAGCTIETELFVCILEALAMLDPDILRSSFKCLQKDAKFQLNGRVDKVVSFCKRYFDQSERLVSVKNRLDFLSLIWHCNARGCILPTSGSGLIRGAVKHLEKVGPTSLSWTALFNSAVVALSTAALGGELVGSSIDETIWTLLSDARRADLVTASSMSYFIMATDSFPKPIYIHMCWDYLRDVLQLILRHHFLDVDEALALTICPVLCGALSRLLSADRHAARFSLSSPWTMCLCTDLKRTLKETASLAPYESALRDRLVEPASVLLHTINSGLLNSIKVQYSASL